MEASFSTSVVPKGGALLVVGGRTSSHFLSLTLIPRPVMIAVKDEGHTVVIRLRVVSLFCIVYRFSYVLSFQYS